MDGHDRRRRRARPAREPAVSGAPSLEPRVEGLLALQRTAGNRAVQRLIYNEGSASLYVPRSYADQRIAWDAPYVGSRGVKAEDPTLLELSKRDGAVRDHIAHGMDVTKVAEMKPMADASMGTNARGLATPEAEKGTADQIQAVAPDPNRLLYRYGQELFGSPAELDVRLVMSPSDYLPEKPDLGASGVSVRAPIPGKKLGETYWEYVCVLIALVKADGYTPVQRITGQAATGLQPAVQALHDHYVDQGVQYDDSSTRFRVMRDWGYRLIFAGRSSWAELPSHVELRRGGNYIFDIDGHTVKVDVHQNVERNGKPLANPSKVFEPQSEEDNYDQDEFAEDVLYIWSK